MKAINQNAAEILWNKESWNVYRLLYAIYNAIHSLCLLLNRNDVHVCVYVCAIESSGSIMLKFDLWFVHVQAVLIFQQHTCLFAKD